MSSTPAHAGPAHRASLANRYGTAPRGGRRRLWTVVGAVALLAAVVAAVALGVTTSLGRVESKEVGYVIHDDAHASVTFQVTLPSGVEAASCDVVVMDEQAAPVGFRTVRVSGTDQAHRGDAVTYTADVRTVGHGVTGVVEACRPA